MEERRIWDADAIPIEENLPNWHQAEVDESKIVDYLLSTTHPEGMDKSIFFLSFGFSSERWQEFAAALVSHAKSNEVTDTIDSPYGLRYLVEGTLETPDGRNPRIRAIWQTDSRSSIPRLITAYPLRR